MTSIFIARPLFTLCYRLLCSVKYKGGDVKGIVGKARIAPPNTGNSAAPRRLPPRQGDPCKRSASTARQLQTLVRQCTRWSRLNSHCAALRVPCLVNARRNRDAPAFL